MEDLRVFPFVGFFYFLLPEADGIQMAGQLETYRIGSRIRISSGELQGLTGLVARECDDRLKYWLTIDGFPKGVYVTAASDMLTLDDGEQENRR